MAINLDITANDFESICRTCLSREGLNPLYEKSLAEMLMTCTVVKFAENDRLPAKICINCINEINQAFSFAKRCEITDKILRKCMIIKLENDAPNNSPHSQKLEPTIRTNQEIKIEQPDTEVLGNYVYIEEFKREKDGEMECEENMMKIELHTKIEIEYDKTYDGLLDESNEEEDDDGVQDETDYDNPAFRNRHNCIYSQIEEKSVKHEDRGNYDDNNQDRTYSEEPDNPGCRLKRKTTNSQINDYKSFEKSRPYACEVCSKSFSQKITLKNHMRIHTGEKPYTCNVCSKSFRHNITLKTHMRLHTGEKPFVCEVCSKAFVEQSALQKHKRIHSEEKPYACGVCSAGFKQSNYLKQHMRRHTGEKPYTCEVCSKQFAQASNLRVHMRIHTTV